MSNSTKLEMPTKLGSASRCARVSSDKLSVKYHNAAVGNKDVGAVQANKPAPEVKGAVYYFEMRVKNAGRYGKMGIGFTKAGSDLTRMPGWQPETIGYHGDDGCIFKSRGRGEPFGPKFTTNDIIGAGIDYDSNEFFFTKNGELVGALTKKINGPLFPTIGLHSEDEEVEVNFGHKPFVYDIKRPIIYGHHLEVFDSKSFTIYDESWKKLIGEKDRLLAEKDKLMEKSESFMKKSFGEKDRLLVEKDKLIEKSELLMKKSLEEKDQLLAKMDQVLIEKDKLMENSKLLMMESLKEKDQLMEKSEALMKKSLEEKDWLLAEKDKLIENSELLTKKSLEEKDQLLAKMDQVLIEKDKLIGNSKSLMTKFLEEKDQLLAQKDQLLAQKDEFLIEKKKLTEKSELLTRKSIDEKSIVFKSFFVLCCVGVLATLYTHKSTNDIFTEI